MVPEYECFNFTVCCLRNRSKTVRSTEAVFDMELGDTSITSPQSNHRTYTIETGLNLEQKFAAFSRRETQFRLLRTVQQECHGVKGQALMKALYDAAVLWSFKGGDAHDMRAYGEAELHPTHS
jgi:hypothetical protein